MTTSKNAIFVGVIFHTLAYRLFPYSCIFCFVFFFFKEDREIITILVQKTNRLDRYATLLGRYKYLKEVVIALSIIAITPIL